MFRLDAITAAGVAYYGLGVVGRDRSTLSLFMRMMSKGREGLAGPFVAHASSRYSAGTSYRTTSSWPG